MAIRIFFLTLWIAATGFTLAQAESQYFALDGDFMQTSTIIEVCFESGRTSYSSNTKCLTFDDSGGSLDSSMGRIVGKDVDGEEVSVALKNVSWIKIIMISKPGFEAIKVRIDFLKQGDRWRPRGNIKQAVLSTGEILRYEGMAPVLDIERRIILWTFTGDTPVEIHFRDLLCIQIERSSGSSSPVKNNNGYISGVELLSGETMDLVGQTPTLDQGERVIRFGRRQDPVAEIQLTDVRYVHIDRWKEQDAGSSKNGLCGNIEAGSRIRLKVNSGFDLEALETREDEDFLMGELESCGDGELVFKPQEPGSDVVRVPMENVQLLYVSRGTSGHTLEGAALGLAVGLLVALASQSSADGLSEFDDSIYRGVGITVAGTIIGALTGSAIRSEKWKKVHVDYSGISLGKNPPGEYQLAFGFSF